MSGRTLVSRTYRRLSGMLFYIMMLETKGILARSLFFPPGKQRLTYPIKSHKREDRRKDSLRSLIASLLSYHSSTEWQAPPFPPPPTQIAGIPRLIGIFASVLPALSNSTSSPHAWKAEAVALTISQSFGWLPAGRFPICFTSTVIRPL